ncbi:MAG: thioredoxin [Bdellovibrionales bacterium]|nr:thioredoxin [Bdellovibrionales bacterium]
MANSKNVLTATDSNLETEVMKNTELTLVDFWAEWCGPCRALAPTLDALADEYQGKVKVYKLNVDENPESAQKFKVRGIPTVMLVKGGQVVDQLVGNQPKDSFVTVIQKHL